MKKIINNTFIVALFLLLIVGCVKKEKSDFVPYITVMFDGDRSIRADYYQEYKENSNGIIVFYINSTFENNEFFELYSAILTLIDKKKWNYDYLMYDVMYDKYLDKDFIDSIRVLNDSILIKKSYITIKESDSIGDDQFMFYMREE